MTEDLITIFLVLVCSVVLFYLHSHDEFDYNPNNNKKNNKQKELDSLNNQLDELSERMVLNRDNKYDDLTKIEGIGPKIQEILYNKGIKTFEILSYTYISDLQRILDEAGNNFNMANPKNWPIQAKLAHEGKWKELEEYQEFLYKGINLELDAKIN